MPELRLARATDIPRLIEIRAAVRENRLRSLVIGPDDYLPYVRDGCCWVWEARDCVHGFAALDTKAGSVWALFVDPTSEGRGIGRGLLGRLVAEARSRGLLHLALETASDTRAEAVYRRFGFVVSARQGGSTLMALTLG